MKPIPSTVETRRREVIKRCREGVERPSPGWHPSVLVRYRAVVDLGPDPSAKAIMAAQHDAMMAIGAHPYSDLRPVVGCMGCGREVASVVQVGEEPDYESATTDLCRDCLIEALAALVAAERGASEKPDDGRGGGE